MSCYCEAMQNISSVNVYYIEFLVGTEVKYFCRDWLLSQGIDKSIVVGSSLIIIIIDVIIAYIVPFMTKFERHHSE